ncbi:MAG: PSD1 and planctomycete cytochrome C domain-containing protein, partial [Rhodopirellula sp. JB053]
MKEHLVPFLCCLVIGLAVIPGVTWANESDATTVVSQTTEIRFNRDVRPILSDKCFACHGPDADNAAGGLRLDNEEDAIDFGAITPGDPDDSELVNRILSDDEDLLMPPVDAHKPLTAQERETLIRWIAQGAQYEPHWAYAPLQSSVDRETDQWIDQLIQRKWHEEGVTPAPPADRITLIRRLSMDLTGIPPTIEEVDAFVNDDSPQAYENLIDRLLSTPRYGERMAAYWLDLVRYADTVGYHGDQNISQWPYRDYVINAFHDNMPYDQFIREQLAGDLLPSPTTNQLIASGYNRLNQTTEEGGAQAKEYLAIYFADRVRNASQVFMGSTLGCAQCHDHKYDPFTAKDFYAFGAFFADIEERGVYSARSRPPLLKLPTEEQSKQIASLKNAISDAKQQRDQFQQKLITELDHWTPPTEIGVDRVWVDDNQRPKRTHRGEWRYVSSESDPIQSGTASRFQTNSALVQHFVENAADRITVSPNTHFFAWVYLDPENPPKAIMLQYNDSKGWAHRAVWGSDDIVYGRNDEDWEGYRRMGALPPIGQWVRLQVDATEVGLSPQDTAKSKPKTTTVNGMAFTQFGGAAWWDEAGWNERTPDAVISAWQTPKAERSDEQTKNLETYYLSLSTPLQEKNSRIAQLENELAKVEREVPTTVVTKSVKPRTIRILPRGNWMDDSGEIVDPAVPEFLGSLDTEQRRATRLDLAQWLCQEDNPLTARTMVNRLWSLMFGRGICTSVDDFGGQGTYPSNPDLLDALAIEFIQSGWDVKHIIKTIALSETYQRSSRSTAELDQRDPYNDLFARQGRFRIDAEYVRDTALAVSGLLVEKVGGPSVRPYQPEGYYAQLNFPNRKYPADNNDSQYRRGVYTHWQRTFLHPMLKAFDAPSREECTAQRARSSTPLQSLTLLNDPSFVEAARVYATRV